jgi:ATP-dependent DNA helicase RecG
VKQIKQKQAINRIVIGDVGSGKTIVAFLVALTYLQGLKNGEVALLAPTEVLAHQHYQSLLQYLETIKTETDFTTPTPIFLSSKLYEIDGEKFTKSKAIIQIQTLQTEGRKLFWVGTHSLLHFEQLDPDLVLIDEQHRFGVQQRKKLTAKDDDTQAHFISFTATPIPRTLALTFFDTLKPHFLETLSSRKAIRTIQNNQENFLESALPLIKSRIDKGEKVYIINAKVLDKEDGEEEDEVWSIKKTFALLEPYFPGEILVVHGKETEKKNILREFKESTEKNILIATTVVEVGVDVGSATLMLILNSERYGLSALHQIRGRIGRNDLEDNLCILYTPQKYRFIKRLGFLKDNNDGFALAEKDLELRGSGDVIGKIQSGFDFEIDELLGLPTEQYEEIKQLAQTAIEQKNLPRLDSYLEKELGKIWEE